MDPDSNSDQDCQPQVKLGFRTELLCEMKGRESDSVLQALSQGVCMQSKFSSLGCSRQKSFSCFV